MRHWALIALLTVIATSACVGPRRTGGAAALSLHPSRYARSPKV